jgi:uncharacterized protein YaaR (DUF327 family)
MKIQKVKGAKAKGMSAQKVGTKPSISFEEILNIEKTHDEYNKYQERIDEIREVGERLAEKKTVETLVEYKKMIKEFLEEAVDVALKLDERRSFSRSARTSILRTVSNIDEKLIELTDMIIKKERKQIRLLEKIGEIQGLLVNLFV